MAKQRLAYIDFMKGLCIMLIVMHHTDEGFFDSLASGLDNALQSFRVPMYYFLSGLFFKTYSGFSNFIRRKINNLVIPFVFFHIVGYLIAAASFYLLSQEGQFNWNDMMHPVVHRTWSYTMPLWFLASLFEVNLIYYFIRRYTSLSITTVIVVAMSPLPIILASHHTTLPLLLDTALLGLPFFALGALVSSAGYLMPHKLDKWAFIGFPFIAIIVYYFAAHIDIVQQELPNYAQLYLLPMASILSLMWLSKNLRCRLHNSSEKRQQAIYKRIPIIGYWGQFSLIVLGTHDWILTPLDILFTATPLSAVSLALIKWSITMTLMFVIIPLLVRFFPKFTAQKPLLRI